MHTSNQKFRLPVILILLLISIFSCTIWAENNDDKLKLFVAETQKSSDTTFAWWLPQEYWKTSAEIISSSSIETAKAMEVCADYFRPYIVILVAHTDTASPTKDGFFSESEILSDIRLIDEHGFSHYPLTKKQINPNFYKLLTNLKPGFTDSLGTLGKHLFFVVFDAEDKDGLIVDTAKESQFKIKIQHEELAWQLPFESLIPLKVCSICQQKLNGKFRFCPWDGNPLP